MLNELIPLSRNLIRLRQRDFKRYFLRDNPLTNRFSIIIGQRGIGKTTAMIQRLKEYADNHSVDKALYLQTDHFLVARSSLYEITAEFYKLGGEMICFDEIHKYPEWSKELKSIFDTFPNLTIIASGSSALEITKGSHDLSRRALVYRMYGMSFREFIGMHAGIYFDSIPLEALLEGHCRVAGDIVALLEKNKLKVLALFRDYLEYGYYPYYLEYKDKGQFYLTLEQNIHTTLESDLPAIHATLNGATVRRIEKLLSIISSLSPFTPDMKSLKELLGIGDERTLKTYLKYLEDAGVILTVAKSGRGFRVMEKPEKIYLNNPNIYNALAGNGLPDIGALRETFLLSMLRVGHSVSVPAKGDFLIDDRRTIGVGGKGKDARQIRDTLDAWLALDGIETGYGNRIPLWLFGFIY